MVTGMSMLGLTFSPFLILHSPHTGHALLERILLNDGDDPAFVYALDG